MSESRREQARGVSRAVECGRLIREHRYEIAVSLVLLVGSFILYFAIAQAYRTIPGYAEYRNTFFNADHNEAVHGWVEGHKGIHPLLLLLVVPLGRLTAWLTGSYEAGVVLSAAGFGAIANVLVYWIVRILVGRPLLASVITAFYGVSMSQLVFAALPDSYVMVVVSLAPTYLLTLWSLRTKNVHIVHWVLAGLVAFAITITSFMHTILCLLVVLGVTRPWSRIWRPLLVFFLAVGLLAVVLSLFQAWLIPGSVVFYMSDVYEHETEFLELQPPQVIFKETVRSFLLLNFVGQEPQAKAYEPGLGVMFVYFRTPLRYTWLGTCAVLLWLLLFAHGSVSSARCERTRLFTLCAALSVLFNVGMHTIYSTSELFLYTPHFTYAVLWLALSPRSVRRNWTVVAWIVLVLLTAANNLIVVRGIVERFGEPG